MCVADGAGARRLERQSADIDDGLDEHCVANGSNAVLDESCRRQPGPPIGSRQQPLFHLACTAFTQPDNDDAPAAVRCWHDLYDHLDHQVDADTYTDRVGVPQGTNAVADDIGGDEFVTAVQARVDELLHEREPPLSVDAASQPNSRPVYTLIFFGPPPRNPARVPGTLVSCRRRSGSATSP